MKGFKVLLLCAWGIRAYLLSSCSMIPLRATDDTWQRPCSEGLDLSVDPDLGSEASDAELEAAGILPAIIRSSLTRALEFEAANATDMHDPAQPIWPIIVDTPGSMKWNAYSASASEGTILEYKKSFHLALHFEPGSIEDSTAQKQQRRWHIKVANPNIEMNQALAEALYSSAHNYFIDKGVQLASGKLRAYDIGDNHFTYDEPEMTNPRSYARIMDPTFCRCRPDTTTTTTSTTPVTTVTTTETTPATTMTTPSDTEQSTITTHETTLPTTTSTTMTTTERTTTTTTTTTTSETSLPTIPVSLLTTTTTTTPQPTVSLSLLTTTTTTTTPQPTVSLSLLTTPTTTTTTTPRSTVSLSLLTTPTTTTTTTTTTRPTVSLSLLTTTTTTTTPRSTVSLSLLTTPTTTTTTSTTTQPTVSLSLLTTPTTTTTTTTTTPRPTVSLSLLTTSTTETTLTSTTTAEPTETTEPTSTTTTRRTRSTRVTRPWQSPGTAHRALASVEPKNLITRVAGATVALTGLVALVAVLVR